MYIDRFEFKRKGKMTDIGITILISWAIIGGLLLATNRDLLSPSKILHIYLLLFYIGILFRDETPSIYLTYIVLLLASLFIGLFEALSLRNHKLKFKHKSYLSFTEKQTHQLLFFLWLGTIVPVLTQLYMIISFGGFFQYLMMMALRVKEFGGWGPVLLIIKSIFIFNIIYFVVLFLSDCKSKKAISAFIFHSILSTSIGLLTGSRSLVLMNFFSMLVVYNYRIRPVPIKAALSIGIALYMVAAILGQIRAGGMSISKDNVALKVGSSGPSFEEKAKTSDSLSAGLVGLRLIYDQNVDDLQYGQTFLTILTNLVPSVLWDQKPRTGGFVLTQDFTGDSWGGFSNLSTGILAEFMLNFGLGIGLTTGFCFLVIIFLLFNSTYLRVRYRTGETSGFHAVWEIITYLWVLQALTALLIGEFANVIIGLLMQLLSLFIIISLLKFLLNSIRFMDPPIKKLELK